MCISLILVLFGIKLTHDKSLIVKYIEQKWLGKCLDNLDSLFIIMLCFEIKKNLNLSPCFAN